MEKINLQKSIHFTILKLFDLANLVLRGLNRRFLAIKIMTLLKTGGIGSDRLNSTQIDSNPLKSTQISLNRFISFG